MVMHYAFLLDGCNTFQEQVRLSYNSEIELKLFPWKILSHSSDMSRLLEAEATRYESWTDTFSSHKAFPLPSDDTTYKSEDSCTTASNGT